MQYTCLPLVIALTVLILPNTIVQFSSVNSGTVSGGAGS